MINRKWEVKTIKTCANRGTGPKLFDLYEAADYLGIGLERLCDLLSNNIIPHNEIKGKVTMLQDNVIEYKKSLENE